jgi:hypothetical protein
MVATVGAAQRNGKRTLAATAAAFAAGLATGSALVFGALGLAGRILHPGGAFIVCAAVLAGAAVATDAAGFRVRPQIRAQVPERWRRTMPLSRAVFLYGGLLGTGVTTFVPAAAAWALMALALALGNMTLALVVGLCLAAGRALPVLVFAPLGDEAAGLAFVTERPTALRVVRGLAALSLAIGVATLVAGEVQAATTVVSPGGDPSAAGLDVAWQTPGVGGFLRRNGMTTQLPGNDPAIGDMVAAWHTGDLVTIAARDTLAPVSQLTIPGVQKLAVSAHWLVYRVLRPDGNLEIDAQSLSSPAPPPVVITARPAGQLGRPFVVGGLVLFHVATSSGSWITAFDLTTGMRRTVIRSIDAQLLNPSVFAGNVVFVRDSRCSQQVRLIGIAGGAERVLYQLPPLAGSDLGHERGHTDQGSYLPCGAKPPKPTAKILWTTAFASTGAYVTVLSPAGGGTTTPTLLRLGRRLK